MAQRERRGRRAIVGVRAGTTLGRVRVRRGYATVARRLGRRAIYRGRWARARKGVPIGTGRNAGFVRARPPRRSPPGDRDADGVPDTLDVDLNGNLVLNTFDRSGASSRAERAQASVPIKVFGNPILDLDLPDTVNANAPGLTDEQIESALPMFGRVALGIAGIEADPDTDVELDCGDPNSGLVYCRKNGSSGTVSEPLPGVSQGASFPGCCDPDGDGFGSLTRVVPPGGVPIYYVPLLHHATSAEIGTGNVVRVLATIGGAPFERWDNLQFVFQSVPAVVSYSDGQGNAAAIDYPVAAPDPQTGMGGGPGTRENPLPVKAGPDGHVRVTLTFWRPQRRPIPPDPATGLGGDACMNNDPPCQWIDLGHTVYGANISDIGLQCPEAAYGAHPNLTFFAPGFRQEAGLLDSSDDQPADPAQTLSFTLDLTQCLAARGLAFDPGDTRGIDLAANPAAAIPGGPPPTAQARVMFRRQESG